MPMTVFVQNEAGSNRKHYHNEKTLELQRAVEVSERYPFPYGFVVGTTAEDGCNVDCYIITETPLATGQLVECEPLGLMEQIEDGQEDHNVLARLVGEIAMVDAGVRERLTAFVQRVFAHAGEKRISVGRFLGPDAAEAHVIAHLDRDEHKPKLMPEAVVTITAEPRRVIESRFQEKLAVQDEHPKGHPTGC